MHSGERRSAGGCMLPEPTRGAGSGHRVIQSDEKELDAAHGYAGQVGDQDRLSMAEATVPE